MAKVIGPLHSDHVKGSMSGMQFSEYRGMAVCKRKLRPVLRMRTVQPTNRAILSWLARSWGGELPENRALWDNWAATHPIPNGFGGTFQLDGNQAYNMLNHTAVRLGGEVAKKSAPPSANLTKVVDTLSAVPAPTSVALSWTVFGTGLAADYCEVRIAGPFSSIGRRAIYSRLKYLADVAGNIATYTALGLQANTSYWFAVRYVGVDGQRSTWQFIQVQL